MAPIMKGRGMSRKVIIVLCLLSMIICHVLPNMAYLKADSEDVSYRISSNAIITYKKNENKVYYTREHFSSGSGIKYYTMYLVISMMEAKSTDDLSNLESNGDFSEIICVSVSGSSVTESSVIKSGDFYWYDSEKNDDGYIKTTYVIDGNVFLNLLDKAEVAGRSGAIYIHHVFAVAGGSENDDWHKKYGVKNNVPYYKYSDLMKVGWNDTTATHASQNACLNIPVPYSRPKTVDLGFVPYGSSGGSEISVTNTATPTPSLTSAPRVTPTPTPSPKVTPKPTVTPNPTVTAEPTGTPSPTVSPSPFVPGAIISLIPGIIGPIVNFPWPTPTPTPIPVYVEPIVPPAPTLTPTLIPTGSLVTSPSPEPVLYVTPEPTPTERPEISIQVVSGNIKYVQNLDADKDCAQVVLGNAVSQTLSLQIQNYDSDVRVSFPFDVYVENGTLLPSYTWNRMHSSYLVPEDTPEGRYTIRAAIETDSGNLSSYHEAELEVSGKLYGLGITNINTDAPDWKGVFGRDGVSSGNMVLYSGQNDEMGIGRGQGLNKTLPMVDGDSPNNNMCGMLKSGYTWTFRLNTCGDRMAKPNAHIVIVPTFYYICPEKGGGSYIEGYNVGGFSPRSQSSWTRERVRVYGTDLKEVGTRILASQTSSEMVGGEKTHREWTFEYSLPDVWYCASMEYDVEQYMEKKGGVTFKEEFWKKGGYLVVCFEIGAYDSSGKLVMTYSNKIENVMAGMCDMWRMENALKQKTDCLGTTFPLTEEDVVIVRLPGSTRDANGNPSPPTNASEDKTVSYK